MTAIVEPEAKNTREAVAARVQRIKQLFEDGVEPEVIAERVGLSLRQTHRWLTKHFGDSWVRKAPAISPETRALVIALALQQVPPRWIAETAGCSRKSVDGIREQESLPLDEEWNVVRLQIQADSELFRLHRQFSPRPVARLDPRVSRKDDH